MDTLFDDITNSISDNNSTNNKQVIIDLKTEFDSFEYLVWVNAKAKFKNSFYISNTDSLKYLSYSKNVTEPKLYNIELSEKNKNWTLRYKH